MTIEEKLQHFTDFCMNDAKIHAQKILDEYNEGLQHTFNERKNDAIRRQNLHIKIEKENLMREMNKTVSLSELKYRKLIGNEKSVITEKIFTELKNKLEEFMSTNAYYELLNKQIKEAVEFANGKSIDIYLDPNDDMLIKRLSMENNVNIKLSKYSFSGGMRAVIPKKNILIDNSFEKKISDAMNAFHFNIEGGNDD